jgi:hypothetical protein
MLFGSWAAAEAQNTPHRRTEFQAHGLFNFTLLVGAFRGYFAEALSQWKCRMQSVKLTHAMAARACEAGSLPSSTLAFFQQQKSTSMNCSEKLRPIATGADEKYAS